MLDKYIVGWKRALGGGEIEERRDWRSRPGPGQAAIFRDLFPKQGADVGCEAGSAVITLELQGDHSG